MWWHFFGWELSFWDGVLVSLKRSPSIKTVGCACGCWLLLNVIGWLFVAVVIVAVVLVVFVVVVVIIDSDAAVLLEWGADGAVGERTYSAPKKPARLLEADEYIVRTRTIQKLEDPEEGKYASNMRLFPCSRDSQETVDR